MSKIENYSYFCEICKKEIYEDSPVCKDCKTNEFIKVWGDPFFDEKNLIRNCRRISLPL